MRILFLYPSDSRTFNSGLASLSAVLREAGHQTALYTAGAYEPGGLQAAAAGFRPDIAAVSSVTNQLPLAARWIGEAKKLGLKVILGGIHATLDPEEAVLTPGLDALCVGEGEDALLDFVERISRGEPWSDVPNLWLREGETVVRNPVRPLRADLDGLPDPDYALFDYDRILDESGCLMVFANRGCPYRCNYCVTHALLKLYGAKGFARFTSPAKLVERLGRLVAAYPKARTIEFFDDTFVLNRRWLEAFARLYPQAIGLPFLANARADLVDRDVVRLLSQAGCIRINMAIETGSESLRRGVLAKDVTDADLRRAFRLFRRAGIRTYAHNMVGLPGETEADILRTVRLNRKLRVDDLQCWTFYPYPGTEAGRLCRERGWIVDRGGDATVAGKNVLRVLDQPGIGYERVSFQFRTFKYRVLGDRTPPEDVPADVMIAGREESQMISGWHALESDGPTPFRWTKPEARLYLRRRGKRRLAVLARTFLPGPPPQVTIECAGRQILSATVPQGAWTWLEAEIPRRGGPILEIALRTDPPFPAARLDPRDPRWLGLAVSQIRLETARERKRRRRESPPAHPSR